MKDRMTVSLLGLCALLLAGLLLRLSLPTAAAQAPVSAAAGRYRFGFGAGAYYFVDTQTGQVWMQETVEQRVNGEDRVVGEHWVEADTPVSHPKPTH